MGLLFLEKEESRTPTYEIQVRTLAPDKGVYTGWERTGQMLCIVDTSLSVLMTLRMCLHELCCLFTVWI